MLKIKQLKIADKSTSIPIIQGGMGVGVSLSKLASAVANNGGIGVISGVGIGFREDDFAKNTLEANKRALREEIRKAKKLSPQGIIGVNLMVAVEDYEEYVKVAVEEEIDLIISGAGIPKDLPKFIKGSKTKIAPIVSSAKAANLICRLWKRRYDYLPDLMIIEGPDAGGHLGFSIDQLGNEDQYPDLQEILEESLDIVRKYEEKAGKKIPLIVAGGIFDGKDISKYLKLGASGVQMGTRFVATEECDASIEFKNAYVEAKKEDIDYVISPVGMPGQAIINPFVKRSQMGRIRPTRCYRCLVPCDHTVTPYCISEALINSTLGDIDNGLIFIGKKGYKIDKIVKVKELMDELKNQIIV